MGKQESWTIILLSACLLWTTWTIGGIRLWGQCGTNVLAIAALCVAVWPSEKSGYERIHALLRFIPFWLGVFVSLYIATQALNASWLLETGPDGKTHAVAQNFIKWLPSGVATSWRVMNPWRMLLIFMPCWLATCALWCGCKRLKALRILAWVFTLNGATFAIIGILQAITKTEKILWYFDRPLANKWFWGMMANQNHAAAFMNLALASTLGLFIYYLGRHSKDFAKGGVYLMLVPLSAIIVLGVLQAMSRAGIVVAAIITLVFMAVLLKQFIKFARSGENRALTITSACIMLLVTAAIGVSLRHAINLDKLDHEIRSMLAVADAPEHDVRFFINKASIDLFEKRPAYGWGAGCYRYFISSCQKNYPQLLTSKNKPRRIVYAHNEYLNGLCELGLVGAIPLFAGIIGLPAYVLVFKRKGINDALWVGLAGIGAAMLHMSLEFFMQHPLVALQFALLLAVVTKIADLSAERISQSEHDIKDESQNPA